MRHLSLVVSKTALCNRQVKNDDTCLHFFSTLDPFRTPNGKSSLLETVTEENPFALPSCPQKKRVEGVLLKDPAKWP